MSTEPGLVVTIVDDTVFIKNAITRQAVFTMTADDAVSVLDGLSAIASELKSPVDQEGEQK